MSTAFIILGLSAEEKREALARFLNLPRPCTLHERAVIDLFGRCQADQDPRFLAAWRAVVAERAPASKPA